MAEKERYHGNNVLFPALIFPSHFRLPQKSVPVMNRQDL